MDRRGSLVGAGGDRDPVADGRQVAAAGRLMREPSGGVGAQLAELGEDDVRAAVLRGNARRQVAVRGVRLELGRAAVGPAEVVERVQWMRWLQWLQCVQAGLLERKMGGRARESDAPCTA